MRYSAIEQQISTPEGITQLLDKLQDDHFSIMDYHAQLFRSGALTESAQLQDTIDVMTGIVMELKTIFQIALYTKVNNELHFYHQKKIELDKLNIKVTASVLEKEASYSVSNERRILNLLEGKIDACEKAISTCQSRMKMMTSEMHLAK